MRNTNGARRTIKASPPIRPSGVKRNSMLPLASDERKERKPPEQQRTSARGVPERRDRRSSGDLRFLFTSRLGGSYALWRVSA